MRTNIELDDELLAEAMKYSSARSKRAVVQEALAAYVSAKAEEQRIATYRDRLGGIRRRLADAPIRTPSKDLVRADRDRKS
ncbi:MAG: type II toxin-antitoxin system VapB family antitoxin [Lentisphaerota bacterium]